MENRIIITNMTEAISKIETKNIAVEEIIHISNNKFSYTDKNGITHYYLVFKSFNAYKKGISSLPHNLYKSNSFYIAHFL